MATVRAEIEIVLRIPGTVTYDEQGYIEYLDGNPADNESLFEYITSDPDWNEAADFPIPEFEPHTEVIEVEIVSVNDNLAPDAESPDSSKDPGPRTSDVQSPGEMSLRDEDSVPNPPDSGAVSGVPDTNSP